MPSVGLGSKILNSMGYNNNESPDMFLKSFIIKSNTCYMYLFFLQEQQVNQLNYELSSKREEYSSINTKLENDLREANENIANQVNYRIKFCFFYLICVF